MALTQQLARVSPQYLAQCRQTAADSPNGDPNWNPPAEDTLDLDWAIWGLIKFFRWARIDAVHTNTLERSITGDPGSDVGFLDHAEVYDGFDGPPALLPPEVVTEVAHALDAIDLSKALARLPQDNAEAALACGFEGFAANLPAYLDQHFDTLRAFYHAASHRRLAVVTWVD
ncbi:DUF1877 family protein [Streptomyces sp. NPDC029004]|uniref:DUF1877 family protein n=1 Tax=Streptomyces sp. NPDC029004 TaxID=3154490 RepID=UPI00340A27F9